jgi:hypothetical protein
MVNAPGVEAQTKAEVLLFCLTGISFSIFKMCYVTTIEDTSLLIFI